MFSVWKHQILIPAKQGCRGCSEPWMGAEVGGGGEEENPGLILFQVQVSTQMPRDLIPNK